MKIAVLGAHGFIGSYLYNFLKSHKHIVIPVTRQTLNLEHYSAVHEWMKLTQPDVVVNCAISGGGRRVNDINYSDVQRDLSIFLNFYNCPYTNRYINIGSGAEFDLNKDINTVVEDQILYRRPVESYGFTKNTIARMCLAKNDFYTLRLFGCFDSSESEIRLFKRFLLDTKIKIQDRYFDYISAYDFAQIVDYYCTQQPIFKDINCVYNKKYLLSEILKKLKPGVEPNIDGTVLGKSYTGSGSRLAGMNISLAGLEQGLKNYV